MSVLSVLPPSVQSYVHDFDARARRLALVRAIGVAVAVFSTWMLVCCAIDRFAQLTSSVRGAMLLIGVIAVVIILWRPARASLHTHVDWIDAAARIERRDPQFGQRLVTVASRVLGPAELRGSDDMLRELLREVDRHASARDPAALLPLRRIAGAWAAAAIIALAFAALVRLPALGLPTLAARFLAPQADILPVTSTRLDVRPGSHDVVQSAPLSIEADVRRLPAGGLVSLFLTEDDGEHWSRTTMDPLMPSSPTTAAATVQSTGAHFAFTLASVDRDMRYYITAGDATSRTYTIRVRRPPAVERFAIHYDYPAHTGRPAVTVVNTDGQIEAPVGTRATLTITATEPLDYALLTMEGQKILMDRVDDAERIRRASFVVRRDGRYTLDLISDRKVPGEGPAGTTVVRAIPDAKPLIRLPQAGESLRLHPREIVSLGYDALDDYGVTSLVLVAQKNADKPVEISIPIDGDRRRQEREYELDLANMGLSIGDVLTLVMNATDTAGQRATSEPLHVLVSPRSVDVITYQRIAELNAAAAQAASLNEQLTQASAALDEADREAAAKSLAYSAALNRANRQLTGASESATLMRQALFRALLNSRSTELSNTLATWIDLAQAQSWLGEDLFRRADGPTGMGNESRGQLTASLEVTRVLRDELKVVAIGERAAAVLADRENLRASQRKADVAATQPSGVNPRLTQTLQRAREDIAAGAKEIGLDPAAADLDAQLKARTDAAAALVRAKVPVDFVAAAREWSQSLQRDRTQPVVLDERLTSAAQAEAIRSDADLLRARDLQLAATAAARLESLARADPTGRSLPSSAFNEFVLALAAVQREHDVNRKPAAARAPDELKIASQAATQARPVLQRWAGEPVQYGGRNLFASRSRPRAAVAEELALRAGAETASRNYAAAAELDAALARELAAPTTGTSSSAASTQTAPAAPATQLQAVAKAVEQAKKIDGIGDNQQRLAQETSIEPTSQQAPALAARQGEVADAIGRMNGAPARAARDDAADPNWRSRATAAVLAAQERLAAMPQQLASAQDALPAWRDAVARAEQAKREAGAMPDPQRQPAALRAAAQAERDAADAAQRFQDRRRTVTADAARQMMLSLEPFAPETSEAQDLVDQSLLPALQRLDDASKTGDVTAFARSADEARQAIDTTQRALARAQQELTERDPLVSAKWNARAAADSLARTPPDFRWAQVRQRDASAALNLARDRSIHEAASLRIAALPSMQAIYGPPSPATAQADNATMSDWNPLRARGGSELSSGARELDPPGFEEPLRLYFESLGKRRAEPTTNPTAK